MTLSALLIVRLVTLLDRLVHPIIPKFKMNKIDPSTRVHLVLRIAGFFLMGMAHNRLAIRRCGIDLPTISHGAKCDLKDNTFRLH
jgi:hypothetical protein